mgnify:FL=1
MITDKLNRWFTMLVNLSVLAGIVLVAIQIQQNNDMTKAQMANEYYLLDAQLELTMMGESPALSLEKAIYFPDELNQEDVVILDRYFNFGILQLQRIRKMIELGVADEELYQERARYLIWHLGNEAGRRWWNQYALGEPNELSRDIETVLADSNFQINKEVLDALLVNSEPERQ